ncbi:MAG: DUF87 domain-containing protein [Peptostreptococcaceae bacterium]
MFNKLKNKFSKNKSEHEVDLDLGGNSGRQNNKKEDFINNGRYDVKDFIAPTSIDRSADEYLIVSGKYIRNFVMKGFPQQVHVTWLDYIYNYDGDMDSCIHIEPADDRVAIDEITHKITQFEAQLSTETQKGNIQNLTRLNDTISALYNERSKLERNTEKLYQVQITCNLYADSKDELDKESQQFDNKLRGRKIYMMPTYLRQDEGYKSVLPFGRSYLPDMFRNFNSGALTACFPFYNSEISHESGIYCGQNLTTWRPILIDFYDRSKLNNSNITVIGQAGSGKTFFVSLLTMRSAIRGVRTVIIDPEGEYGKITDSLGGSLIYLAPESSERINPFDIEEADALDENDRPTGIKTVEVKDKVSDVLNLIAVMAGGLSPGQKSATSQILQQLYKMKGINENPKSLYITEPYFDKTTNIMYTNGMRKPMPTFSDFHNLLDMYARKENEKELISLSNALRIFKKGGIYDMFDCQTSKNLMNFKSSPIVTFNISKLEEGVLRPIGMYVALTWTWEKFIKKDPEIKKRVIADEAWMLVSKNMAGSEFTAAFLENASRRIRKRNGGLLVASQNFTEFAESPQGRAVLTNALTNIFLKQNSTDIDLLQETFKLSDGEKLFLLKAQRGEMLLRMNGDSTIGQVIPFEYEKQLIEKRI